MWKQALYASPRSIEARKSDHTHIVSLYCPARSCARIVLLKVSDRSVSSKEVMTYAVLDDQSTDVFVTDSLLDKLDVSGQEVNVQVSTILGTNTLRMRNVSGLQIQDVNGEHSPVKVPYAYAHEKHSCNTS